MGSKAVFIVIEGLDGSGKSSMARQLTYFLEKALQQPVKLSFEPHDASCGGLYIRQVLEKKITQFTPETLMLAFAANRLDHGNRNIHPWLEKEGQILICDRYYLSSLVYQSNDNFSMEQVMALNQNARQPDLTIFMNVSNEICYERMDIRNKPKELFEQNLTETREKYFAAIEFLQKKRNENILVLDASSSMEEVLEQLVQTVSSVLSPAQQKMLAAFTNYSIQGADDFSVQAAQAVNLENLNNKIKEIHQASTRDSRQVLKQAGDLVRQLSLNEKGAVVFSYLENLGYLLSVETDWKEATAVEMEYELPGNLLLKGNILLIKDPQQYNSVLQSVANHDTKMDFLFVFSPGTAESVTTYFERDMIQYANKASSLFPPVQVITEDTLMHYLLSD